MTNKIEINSNKPAQNALEMVAKHNGLIISSGKVTPFHKKFLSPNPSFSYVISSGGNLINELDEYNLSSNVLHSKIMKDINNYMKKTGENLKIIDKSYQHIRNRNIKKDF